MSELHVINKTKMALTKETLKKEFENLGLMSGDTVLVHSSMSSIGWVCGEERTVIEGLIDVLGSGGTLCMPAHSGGNSDPADWMNPPVPKEWFEVIYNNMPAFDPDINPTRGIGRIAEQFRLYPGTKRSNHPQTSFCAMGKYADEITRGHVLTPQLGPDTPLGKLYQLEAKVLLLGVGYDSCTSFHYGEVLSGNTTRKKLGAAVYRGDTREWVWFEDYDYNCDDFDRLGEDFEKHYEVKTGKVGNAVCKLFNIQDGIDFSVTWLRENRS